jgi:hypothetical protein
MAMKHLGRRLVGVGVSVSALLVGSAAVAQAQPPSGRDNVTVWSACESGEAFMQLNFDDYQRNSSAWGTSDDTGYLDYVILTTVRPIKRTNTPWELVKKDGRIVHGAVWKTLPMEYGNYRYRIDPDQGQVNEFFVWVTHTCDMGGFPGDAQ